MRAALRILIVTSLVVGAWALAAPALATHTHAKATGQAGTCVLLAQGAAEEAVDLPAGVFDHNPNVTVAPTAGRNHPLHVLVHTGVAGADGGYWVYDNGESAAHCSAYVND